MVNNSVSKVEEVVAKYCAVFPFQCQSKNAKIDSTRQMERVVAVQWRQCLAYLAKECAPFRYGSNRYQANGSAVAKEEW